MSTEPQMSAEPQMSGETHLHSESILRTLTFRIALFSSEQGDNPATWAVHQQVDVDWQLVATTPSFDTALIALFDAVPWDDETTFSHTDLAPHLFEFTFQVKEQP